MESGSHSLEVLTLRSIPREGYFEREPTNEP
jgi:hypothetical protein